jgi:hypothetical protein
MHATMYARALAPAGHGRHGSLAIHATARLYSPPSCELRLCACFSSIMHLRLELMELMDAKQNKRSS